MGSMASERFSSVVFHARSGIFVTSRTNPTGVENSRVTVTDGQGAFQISSLTPGNYELKVSASGLADWSASNVLASAAPELKPVLAVMKVAPAVTAVTVGLPPDEVAEAQLNQEVKRRVLGVLPNYYVAYQEHPAPLSPGQTHRRALLSCARGVR